MRIGILTYHRAHNYGAFLQAFALSQSLQQQFPGCTVEIIDYDTKASHKTYILRVIQVGKIKGIPYYYRQYHMFLNQLKNLPLSKNRIITDDYEQFREMFENQYDLIVVGSDQVWMTEGMRGFPNAYWLPGKYTAKKVSYAASSRSNMSKMSLNNQEIMHQCLNDFCYIGVRDNATMSEVNKFLENGKTAHFNPDPVFTWDFGDLKERGKRILRDKYGIKDQCKTIGVMVSKKTNADRIINKAIEIGYTPVSFYFKHDKAINAVIDPFEWIAAISALDCMATSLFHGTCFAIKYDVPFIAIEERKSTRDNSKIFDLLTRINCQERYLCPSDSIEKGISTLLVNNSVDFSGTRSALRDRFILSVQEMKDALSLEDKTCLSN
jgi:hypothetical protein